MPPKKRNPNPLSAQKLEPWRQRFEKQAISGQKGPSATYEALRRKIIHALFKRERIIGDLLKEFGRAEEKNQRKTINQYVMIYMGKELVTEKKAKQALAAKIETCLQRCEALSKHLPPGSPIRERMNNALHGIVLSLENIQSELKRA